MLYFLIPLLCVILIILLISAICFFKIFYSPRFLRKDEDFPIPPGKEYEPYKDRMIYWINEYYHREHSDVEVISYDGLNLRGRYYEIEKGAPIEILFHGYRGTSKRDLSGGIARCHALGRNALIVDHRASGMSEGRVITFGVRECRDVCTWIDYVIHNINANAKIIITGISMGAATVMNAAGEDLPDNVVGVLADCGYTSTEDIIKKVIKDMHLPPNLLYPFARLGAIIFGEFDPNKRAPIEALTHSKLPIIFFHGDSDGFVPCYMSEKNYAVCTSEKKRLVIIQGAAHGICFPTDEKRYLSELADFFAEYTNAQGL